MRRLNNLDNKLTSQYIISMSKKIFYLFLLFFFFLSDAFSLTLNDAINTALNNYNPLIEQEYRKNAQFFRYKASLDPYYPSLDLSLGYSNYLDSQLNPTADNRSYYSGSLSLGYKIFDAKRKPQKNSQYIIYLNETYNIDLIKSDLIKLIKDTYFKVVNDKEVLKIREETFSLAEKTYNLAQAKYEVGIAKISDVSQAKVSLENARFELINAKNSLLKSLADLSSITGLSVKEPDITDNFDSFTIPLNEEELKNIAFERRVELIKDYLQEKRLEEERKIIKADLFPSINASINYRRYEDKFFPSPDETTFALTLSYNIFSGMGKYYRDTAYLEEISAQKRRIDETKRNISLEIRKNIIDLNGAYEKLKVAEEIFNSAKKTYEQTYEEYRIGKGELINLLQAENNLANAKIQKINALFNLYLLKSSLEKSAGLRNIEEIK
ncbi:MAG: TolC family protein [Proteobacteria bacterium]|nr:TolC family protein [Pseudomonadota bacterium]